MTRKPFLVLTLIASCAFLSACTPVVVGGAAYIVADQLLEQDGDDGLF